MIERKIDNLGRIVIPEKFRRELGIKSLDTLIFTIEEGKMIIKPKFKACLMCGAKLSNDNKTGLCVACIDKIKAM